MTAENRPTISVVLPCYKEGDHLAALISELSGLIDPTGDTFEFVLVEDGSPDDTWQRIVEICAANENVRALRLSRNFGKELALCAGLDNAEGDAVIVMDADGQHPPSLVPKMISEWRNSGADIVEGVKTDRGKESFITKFGARIFYSLWTRLTGFEMRGASDFKLMNRKAVEAYLKMDERNVFFRGMTAWLGFKRVEIPFVVPDRAGGASSWSVLRLVRLAMTGITAFSSVPLQIVTLSGIVFLLFALIFGIQTLYVYLSGQAVTGFATVILLLLIIGSFLMISLGIIGIYIARIYEEIKFRPRYIVSDRAGQPTISPRTELPTGGDRG